MTKFKKRFIKIGILALMPILALVLCLQNTYAYYFDSDNNLVSNNLANMQSLNSNNVNAVNYYSFNVNNQDLVITQLGNTNDPYIYINDFITLNTGTYSMYYLIDTQEVQLLGLTNNGTSGIAYNIPYQTKSTITINQTTTFGFGFEGNGVVGRTFNIKIMIYEGNNQLDYEPFGIWYNQNDYNEIKNKLDTINAGMLNYLDYIEFSVNDESIEINGDYELSYQDLVDNNLLYNDSTIYINAFDNSTTNPNSNPVRCDIYFNNLPSQLVALLFRGNGFQFNVNIYGNSNIFTRSVNDENNTITQIDNSNIVSIDQISFIFNGDTLTYISFSDYNSIYYENGYQNGYTNGYQNGKIEGSRGGYDNGYTNGYNDGYNEGIEQDLETTGMKTLFNSILSYPVNMIKSVFNFEFMGVNIASVIMFIVSIGIVIFVIKKFKE